VLEVDQVAFSTNGFDQEDYEKLREMFVSESNYFKNLRERGETFL
jgi:hypothetical protein